MMMAVVKSFRMKIILLTKTNIVAGGGISPTVEFNSSSVKTPACDNYLLAEVHGDVMMRSQKVAYYKGNNAFI